MVNVTAVCSGSGNDFPDSKVHVASMGAIWGRQDPGGPDVGPMNFAIWDGAVGQQTISLANVDPDLCRYVASLGHNQLSQLGGY